MAATDARRTRKIASLDEAQGTREANVLWQQFSEILEHIVAPGDPGAEAAEQLGQLYTARRLRAHADTTRDALVSTLPTSLRAMRSGSLGYVEADLLNWALHETSHRVLSVVGHRGVGKSSLLHYVLRNLPSEHTSISDAIWPMILDVREEPRVSTERTVFNLLFRHIETRYHHDESVKRLVSPETWNTLPGYFPSFDSARTNHPDVARRLLDGLVSQLARIASERRKRLIIVFDNIDQLSPISATRVLSIARSLAIAFGIRIVVALRPFSLRTQLERGFDLGAFVSTTITVQPPDLRSLMKARINYWISQFPKTMLPFGKSMMMDLGPLEQSLDLILGYFASVGIQERLLNDLCNLDTRRGLRALKSFLRYRKLPIGAFTRGLLLEGASHADLAKSRTAQYHLINGIMIDDYRYYREEMSHGQNVVMNMFEMSRRPKEYDRIVQYYILSFLLWKGSYVSYETINRTLRKFFSGDSVRIACERLLKFGLLESPIHDEYLFDDSMFSVSSTGMYYHRELVESQDYIYNVVYDVHLAHLSWTQHENEYSARIDSICELFEVLVEDELTLLSSMDGQPCREIVEAIDPAGFLSSRILAALERLCQTGVHSDLSDRARDRAKNLREYLTGTGRQLVEKLQSRFAELKARVLFPTGALCSEQTVEVGTLGRLKVRCCKDDEMGGLVELGLDWHPWPGEDNAGSLIAMIQPGTGLRPVEGERCIVRLGGTSQSRVMLRKHAGGTITAFAKILIVGGGMGLGCIRIEE